MSITGWAPLDLVMEYPRLIELGGLLDLRKKHQFLDGVIDRGIPRESANYFEHALPRDAMWLAEFYSYWLQSRMKMRPNARVQLRTALPEDVARRRTTTSRLSAATRC